MNNEAPKPKRWKRWLRILAIFFGICAIWLLWYRPDQWRFRHELPWGAQDVHEWHRADGFLPDYWYLLKAKITEPQFHRYVAKFGLTPHTAVRQYSESADPWLSWQAAPGFDGSWWNPSDSLDGTFVWQGYDTWTYAKYEQGYLYLSSLNH